MSSEHMNDQTESYSLVGTIQYTSCQVVMGIFAMLLPNLFHKQKVKYVNRIAELPFALTLVRNL